MECAWVEMIVKPLLPHPLESVQTLACGWGQAHHPLLLLLGNLLPHYLHLLGVVGRLLLHDSHQKSFQGYWVDVHVHGYGMIRQWGVVEARGHGEVSRGWGDVVAKDHGRVRDGYGDAVTKD